MAFLVNRYACRLASLIQPRSCVFFMSTDAENAPAKKKKKRPPEVRINLIENKNLTVMSLESAQKLANHKGFQLTPVDEPVHWMQVGNRRAYELLTPSSKVASKKEDDMKQLGFKGLKKSIFSTSIHENDIQTKFKQINKWISSGFVIDVAVDKSEKSDDIIARLEDLIRDSAKLPGTLKRNSSALIRLQYFPILKLESKKESNEEVKQEAKQEV